MPKTAWQKAMERAREALNQDVIVSTEFTNKAIEEATGWKSPLEGGKPKKKSKYKNKKAFYNGFAYHSKGEANRAKYWDGMNEGERLD